MIFFSLTHLLHIQIPYSKGEQYAQQVNAIFVETSALEATNVEEVFVHISELKSLKSLSGILQFFFSCLIPCV